jgi:two-component system OmpR family response regulator
MADILLVEDSTDVRDAVYAVLGDHRVSWVSTLSEAREQLARKKAIGEEPFDLVLLDIDLPDGDGIEFLESENTNTVLSRTIGFTLGALDYIAKPFDLVEFQVRVNAKLGQRHPAEPAPVNNLILSGKIELDLTRQQAFSVAEDPKRQIDLTPVEFRLLLLFLQNAGQVVPRALILDTVWGQTAHVSARCVDHHVCGLRKKITPTDARIESVYGIGYRIDT